MPDAFSFSDVVVSTFDQLLNAPQGGSPHRGGPDWPDFDRQTLVRFRRNDSPVDTRPRPQEPTQIIEERFAWGGPIVHHFGHQIADFSTRLLDTVSDFPATKIAFSVRVASPIMAATDFPNFFLEILSWYGIDIQKVVLIKEPIMVRDLLVFPQAEQIRSSPSEDYLDRLDALVAERLGEVQKSGVVFVSRAGQRARFTGEAYLEQCLSRCGVRVIRPETMDLRSQLKAYCSASVLVFSEGSALHGAQLLGRNLATVVVLKRRPKNFLARDNISPRSENLVYKDFSVDLLPGHGPNGRNYGLSMTCPEVVLKTFDEIGVGIASFFDIQTFRKACEKDSLEWLKGETARLDKETATCLVANTVKAAAKHGLLLDTTASKTQ